jgi:predicted DNA-binding transcriptional regulator YafY
MRQSRPNPHMAIARIERQHRLIEELRARAPRYVSSDRLGRDLGVSVRTIERDVADLMDAGVPIDVRRGPGGGYSIDARAKLPPVVLTPGEAAAIITALTAVGPYASGTGRSALQKLIAALTNERSQ